MAREADHAQQRHPIFGTAGSEWWNGDGWRADFGMSCLLAVFVAALTLRSA
jgi:hypothetical protein